MRIVRTLIGILDAFRLGLGSLCKGIAMISFAGVMLAVILMFLALAVDMIAWNTWNYSTGFFSVFMSTPYHRNDTGLEGIAALYLVVLAAGGVSYCIGWVLRLGHNEDDHRNF